MYIHSETKFYRRVSATEVATEGDFGGGQREEITLKLLGK